MFNFCILLNKAPFYIFTDTYDRAIKISSEKHLDVIGVIKGKDLMFLSVQNKIDLEHTQMFQIEEKKEIIEKDIEVEVCDELIEDLKLEPQVMLGLS